MRKPLFIANWKMNLNLSAQEHLVDGIIKQVIPSDLDVIVCPSYTNIPYVSQKIKNINIALGAQDVSWVDKGSMTGEVSADMLVDFGVEYVIIGHSERREKMGETEKQVNEKVIACLKNNLIPIICVGETLEEKQAGQTDSKIERQVSTALKNIKLNKNQSIIIAYEPIWVIGTGKVVDASVAEHEAKVIRSVVHDCLHDLGRETDDLVTVLYGGSVASDNVNDFLSNIIRGVLVGGASLEVDEFGNIIKALSGQSS